MYYAEIWGGNIGEGIECLLGMDCMVSAGVRLSAGEGTVRLPDEEIIPMGSTYRFKPQFAFKMT